MAKQVSSFRSSASVKAPGLSRRLAAACHRFLEALSVEQQHKANLPFDHDEERSFWHYTPINRRGLPLREMSPAQKDLALAIISSGLSGAGFATASAIMAHESILRQVEEDKGVQGFERRDPDLYYFSVFGEPGGKLPWASRVEGHHLSLHFTVLDGQWLAVTPNFFGANPADVLYGPHQGKRILATYEDKARTLTESLSPKQREAAIVSDAAPQDILTTNQPRVDPLQLPDEGIAMSDLSRAQRGLLMAVVSDYVDRVYSEAAEQIDERLRAFTNDLRFVWMGGIHKHEPHYYRIHGGTFLVEYDNFQNEANHIHTVWRDVQADFGADLLHRHYQLHHQRLAE